MKEETVRALTLAACALQAYALAKSFKREVIDPYRSSTKEDTTQSLETMTPDVLRDYNPCTRDTLKERYGVDAQDVLATLHKPNGEPLPLNEAWNMLESVQKLIVKKAHEVARVQTVADMNL